MKTIIIILISLLITSALKAQPWEFNISLEKENYVEGDPIDLLVTLKNISNSDYEITYLSSGGAYKILLRDEHGNIIPDPTERSNKQFIKELDMIFKPNEEDITIFAIGTIFGKDFFKKNMMQYLKAGKYSVQVRFEDLLIRNKIDTLRHKYYYSKELAFEVVPLNTKLKKQLNKFIYLYEKRFQLGWGNYYESVIKLLKNNINNPFVYMLGFYLRIGGAYAYQENEVIDLITKYPNRYWAAGLATSYYNATRNKIRFDDKLKNTLVDKFIRRNKLIVREMKKYEGIYFMSREKLLKSEQKQKRGEK